MDRRTIVQRIEELDGEWDMERVLEAHASSLALTGLLLGMAVDRKWLLLPNAVLPFLLQHVVQGQCPLLPILRRPGVRTRGRDRSGKVCTVRRSGAGAAENPLLARISMISCP
jgi:hypothetical protein